MEIGGSQETVTVTAEEPLVETSTSKIGGQDQSAGIARTAVGQPKFHRFCRLASRRCAEYQHRIFRFGFGQRQRSGSAL